MKRGIQERKDLGLDEFRTGGIQKKRVVGEMRNWRDAGLE